MDTTYFGRERGVTIFRRRHKDVSKRKNLLRYFVKNETNTVYKQGIEFLKSKGRYIQAIVCDGRQGLLGGFGSIPTQLCIHHFKQIIIRYLTKKPILEANIALKTIADDISIWSYESMMGLLDSWYYDYKQWLGEKNDKGKYIHDRTRKAYKSLKKNMIWAYTSTKHPLLDIPNTNNSLESINSHLKSKLRIHRGITLERKRKFIRYYLYIS